MVTDYKKEFFAQQGDFLTLEKAPIVEPSDISITEFLKEWKAFALDHIDYDIEQFPKRFAHDVRMVKYNLCLKRNGYAT